MSHKKTNEIVLFWTHDPAPIQQCDTMILKICLKSIRSRSPTSKIVLLTDNEFLLGEKDDDVEYVRAGIRTEHLMYERERLYAEHIRRRYDEKSTLGITFLDVDTLVNKDLSPIFNNSFDIGLTFRVITGIVLDPRGIPTDSTYASPINGGVIFCKPTLQSVEFFQEHMDIYDRLFLEGGFSEGFVKDIRKWSGGQFAFMAMFGKELLKEPPPTLYYKKAQVRFFDCDHYNYTPNGGEMLTHEYLENIFILHMKGQRKFLMGPVAEFLKI